MILRFWRWLYGYDGYEWELHYKKTWQHGTDFLYICKKTGTIKKVFV